MARATALKAELAFENSKYPETEYLTREAISLYKQTPNKKGLNRTHWRLGTALHSQSVFDAAVDSYDTSHFLSKKIEDSTFIYYSSVTAAVVLSEKGDYKRCFDRLLVLHQLTPTNSGAKVWELRLLAQMYSALEDYSTALKYIKEVSALVEPDYPLLATTFALNKQFDSAKKYYNLSIIDTSNKRANRFGLRFIGEFNFLVVTVTIGSYESPACFFFSVTA